MDVRTSESRTGCGDPAARRRAMAVALLSGTALLLALLGGVGCADEGGLRGAAEAKSPATDRALRRLYDGAPPVIPHDDFGITCTECHNLQGVEIGGVGFAPPSPHELTLGMSAISNCRQCHVFSGAAEPFVANGFVGLAQDLRRGTRLYDGAPPVIPHKTFMRENCSACHTGPAAREPIRTSHPERTRCGQCHVGQATAATFDVAGQIFTFDKGQE